MSRLLGGHCEHDCSKHLLKSVHRHLHTCCGSGHQSRVICENIDSPLGLTRPSSLRPNTVADSRVFQFGEDHIIEHNPQERGVRRALGEAAERVEPVVPTFLGVQDGVPESANLRLIAPV